MRYRATSSAGSRPDFSAISPSRSSSRNSSRRSTWRSHSPKKRPRGNKADMKPRDEIGSLAAAFGSMAADLKDNQDKLLSYARRLESVISDRSNALAHDEANLAISVAERTAQLNAANDEL